MLVWLWVHSWWYNTTVFATQSRQSAKLFLQSQVFGIGTPPTLHPLACVPPPPPGTGGRDTPADERGVGSLGESQFRRGDIHCGTLYIYVLCGLRCVPNALVRLFVSGCYSRLSSRMGHPSLSYKLSWGGGGISAPKTARTQPCLVLFRCNPFNTHC